MTCGIYKITNNLTGESYIGLSKDIEKRWKGHKYSNVQYVDKIIRKVGVDNFSFTILEECSIGELSDKEKYYVDLYDAEENGMNLTSGGETPFNKTGYYRVSKRYTSRYRIGYVYTYIFSADKKQKSISDFSLKNLEKKVKAEGLDWAILNPEQAKISLDENLRDLENLRNPINRNTTGFYKVTKCNSERFKIGYEFQYITDYGSRIHSVNIFTLKNKVEKLGFKWEVINEELAKQTINKNIQDLEKGKLKPHGNVGRKWSDEDIELLSKINTSTGLFRVSKNKNKKSRIGYYFIYTYVDDEGKRRNLSNYNIIDLENKVRNKGFIWKVLDEKKAAETYEKNKLDLINKKPIFKKNRNTDYYRVYKNKCPSCKQGFRYIYKYYENGKYHKLSSISIDGLKEKVLSKNLDWFKLK